MEQNFDLFTVFCQSEQVKALTGRLELRTDRIPWPKKAGQWPQSFRSLQNITQLCIQCPRSTGAVPNVIFTLTALTHLELSGSGYTSMSEDISQLTNLQELDVSHMKLSKLPVVKMATLRKLTSVNCTGVPLASPPPEITRQGAAAVARYILDLDAGVVENTDVLLMLIGDGEAGKTSTLRSLKNLSANTAEEIDVDDRTIGIDISEFKPFPDCPLKFFAWDFGGQAVYAIMQQLFMSRRALYPLLWRVRQALDPTKLNPLLKCDVCRKPLLVPKVAEKAGESSPVPASAGTATKTGKKEKGEAKAARGAGGQTAAPQQAVYRVKGQGLCHAACVSYDALISTWTEHLQFRVPGVTVVLIATHVDCAPAEEVAAQCAAVAEVAQRIVSRQAAVLTDIPPLRIYNNGESFRISNLTGEGVRELREHLRLAAEQLDFYGEVMPSAYVQLRKKLREMQVRGGEGWRSWIPWEEYEELAEKCGITHKDALAVATKFFHETGELRYFGAATAALTHVQRSLLTESEKLLADTVFPNPYWIVDVLRRLIRHDHSEVRRLIEKEPNLNKKQGKALDRRVCRLVTNGILHKSLLPYLWRGVAGKSKDAAANEDEYHRLIALLQAFDILMVKPKDNAGGQWIVPSLSAGRNARVIDADAFADDRLTFVCRMVYDALPPFFDMIFVAHVMNGGSAQSVEFMRGGASFRKFGDRAMVFVGLGKVRDPHSVFRADQIEEPYMGSILRHDQSHLVVAASSRRFLTQLLRDVSRLEDMFPGLQRLGAFFPCYTCRKVRLDRQMCHASEEGFAAAEDAGKVRLQEAEEKDQVARKFLAEVAGAKLSTCNECYERHKEALSTAFMRVEPRLQQLVVLNRWFARGGSMKVAFNNNRKKGCQRYFEEVMKLLVEVRRVMKPTKEEEDQQRKDALHKEIVAAEKIVEARTLAIGELQAGGQLPSLRAVSKFCAKHSDVLSLAWTICEPGAREVCGELVDLLGDGPRKGLLATGGLEREQLVPELMYVLRKLVDAVAPHVKNWFAPSDTIFATVESREQYLAEHALEVQALCDLHHVDLVASPEQFLFRAYGAHTADATAAHFALLRQLVEELDADERAQAARVPSNSVEIRAL